MNATILAVGSSGQNEGLFSVCAKLLTERLSGYGISCSDLTVLAAEEQPLFDALYTASRKNSLLVLLTAAEAQAAQTVTSVICRGMGLAASERSSCVARLRAVGERRGNPLTDTELSAFSSMPEGAVSLETESELVQGYVLATRKQMLLVLPAVPTAVSALFSGPLDAMLSRLEGGSQASILLKAVPLADFSIPDRLAALTLPGGARASCSTGQLDCSIRITASAPSPAQAQQSCRQAAKLIEKELAGYLYAEGEQTLAQATVALLRQRRLRVCYADGTSTAAFAGITGPLPDAGKVIASASGVKPMADASRRTAAQLARAARREGSCEMGAALTGSAEKGLFSILLTDGKNAWLKRLRLDPSLPAAQSESLAALQLLNMLRLYALQYPVPLAGAVELSELLHAKPESKTSTGKGLFLMSLFDRKNQKPKSTQTTRTAAAPSASTSARSADKDQKKKRMNLLQKLIHRQKLNKSDKISLGVLILCLVVLIGCIVYIASVKLESYNYQKQAAELQQMSAAPAKRDTIDGYPEDYLDSFTTLWQQNNDIAGWISIPDTIVDYAVVQAEDNLYYERLDFYKKSNQHGVPFVDFRVDQKLPSTNTIIYGHNMADGQIFGPLLNYKSLAYYREHPIINYNSVYATGSYKIFGVVLCKKDDPDFSYHNFVDKDSLTASGFASMTDFINKIRERSLINTTVDVNETDHLLTLSTCDYSFRDENGDRIARFVVFARKIREGEDTTVNTAGALLNTSPVMPQEWYDYLARQQAAELAAQQAAAASAASLAEAQKWLTEEEIASLSDDEQFQLAELRRTEAAEYLTEEEIAYSDLDEILDLMEERSDLFNRYLTEEELVRYSVKNKIEMAKERAAEAALYLTEAQIESAEDWEELQELIEQAKNTADLQKWLDPADFNNSALSYDQKLALANANKKLASDAGLTASEIAGASSWSELKALIDAKNAAAALRAEMQKLVDDNPRWLTSADLSGAESVSDLEKLMSSREASAKAAGLSDSEINSTKTWADLQKLISEKQASAIEAERTAINQLISDNAPYLTDSEQKTALTGLTLEELENLRQTLTSDINTRKEQASSLSADELAACKNWSDVQSALSAKADQAELDALKAQINADSSYLDNPGQSLDGLSKKELEALVDQIKTNKAKAEQEKAEQERKDYIESNSDYLYSGEDSLSLSELKSLVSERSSYAKDYPDLNPSDFSSWNDYVQAAEASKQDPPSDDNPSSTDSDPSPAEDPEELSTPADPDSTPEPTV